MKKIKRRKKNYKLTIICVILDILAISGFVMMYGPWDKIRNFYVTTTMKTMNHQYLAHVFYSDEFINKILNSNYFIPITEAVSLDDIIIDTSPKKKYDNEYDEAVLTRDGDNEDYKLIELKIGASKAHLVAIYDPTKISLLRAPKFNRGGYGEKLIKMCNRYNAIVCINGGGFEDPTGIGSDRPVGYIIENGEVIWSTNKKGNIIGFSDEGKLLLMADSTGEEAIEAGIVSGLEFGPFLIVNGKPLEMHGDPFGIAPRMAIGQRKDGVVLFLAIDGENYINGATLQDVVDVMVKYGAYNAANLDGGHSSQLVINGALANNPPALAKKQGGRAIVTAFGLLK